MIYKRTDSELMHCDVTHYRRRFFTIRGQLKAEVLLHTKGASKTEHRRIYKSGNSYVLTLSAHLLNHIRVLPGDYVRLEPIRKRTIRITRQRTRVKLPTNQT